MAEQAKSTLGLTLDRSSTDPLQRQLRQGIITAIEQGRLRPAQKMPGSRSLAQSLGVARNTVTLAYDELVARGYLEAQPKRGVFVAVRAQPMPETAAQGAIHWASRLRARPSAFEQIRKMTNWADYPYPFIYGQVDPTLFPIQAWRVCSRDMMGRSALDWWSADRAVDDDPMLIEQIRTRILPARGIFARPEEILITLGAQEGLYLAARLLAGEGARVGLERPGYPDARFIFGLTGAEPVDLGVDAEGAAPVSGLDLAVLTPASHCPTMTVMSSARRADWLDRASDEDFLILEDDYEGELALARGPALKSQDRAGRVIYLGTMSKILAPGVRLGFMVAPEGFVHEARWMRRLLHRSAPLNNQRTAAIFLAEGHYLALMRRLREAHAERWYQVIDRLPQDLAGFRAPDPCHGGSSLWLKLPEGMDNAALLQGALARGVAFELGDPFTGAEGAGRYIRLGLSCIRTEAVRPGLKLLGQVAEAL
ncbi:PLP-dependent aminotransferase family protein [Thioclava sp. GXIMD4216]|uniref:aminotransferase-like domain-containing protein n=1 Tax=Thioclava sp. GXIMD4216 TaxID=3131929 RepID=UPI0030CA8971